MRIVVPLVFVVLWSTGFIVARAAAPHVDLQFFLAVRFAGSAVILGIVAAYHNSGKRGESPVLVPLGIGALMLGVYLCLSYWAVAAGIPAGIMSLLGALQPLFTALWMVAFAGQRLPPRTWFGLIVGFSGVALVLAPKLGASVPGAWPATALLAALFAVLAVTAGTLLQRRVGAPNLWSGAFLQACGGALVAAGATALVGDQHWDGAPVLWLALGWAILAVSVGGMMLLLWMMKQGEATQVTALLLLVPPLASLQAFVFFRERLLPMQLAGFGLALGGVLLARSRPQAR